MKGYPISNNKIPPSNFEFLNKTAIIQIELDQKNNKYNAKYTFIVNPFEKGCLFKKCMNNNKLNINVIIAKGISFFINWYKIINKNLEISKSTSVEEV